MSTELIRTSQSWDGVELPDYLAGRPELVAVKYEIPAGEKLGWHHHPVMNHGILVQGELTIIGLDGQEKVFHEGEVIVEMVNTIHQARHPLHVLPHAERPAHHRAAPGDSSGIAFTITHNYARRTEPFSLRA